MKHFLALSFLFIAPSMALEAEYINPWGAQWDIGVSVGGCMLTRRFLNGLAYEAAYVVGDEQAIFDSFSMEFYIPNETRTNDGKTFVANELYLTIHSQVNPKISEDQLRIDSVRIIDIELRKHLYSAAANFRYFLADGKEARVILKRLEDAEPVNLILGLSDNKFESVAVPSNDSDRFSVWSKLLFACAKANIATP